MQIINIHYMPKNYMPGFWNGLTAQYRIVNIIVGPEPEEITQQIKRQNPYVKRYMWFEAFIGTKRQAVEVKQEGEVFYLDNQDGTGLLKVTIGKASPGFGHRSIYPAVVEEEVQPHEIIKHDILKGIEINKQVDSYWTEKDPLGYAEHKRHIEALRESIKNLRNGRAN